MKATLWNLKKNITRYSSNKKLSLVCWQSWHNTRWKNKKESLLKYQSRKVKTKRCYSDRNILTSLIWILLGHRTQVHMKHKLMKPKLQKKTAIGFLPKHICFWMRNTVKIQQNIIRAEKAFWFIGAMNLKPEEETQIQSQWWIQDSVPFTIQQKKHINLNTKSNGITLNTPQISIIQKQKLN